MEGLQKIRPSLVVLALVLVNVPVIYCGVNNQVHTILTLEGLVLDVVGAAILAVPDVPRLENRSIPRPLRDGRRRLYNKKQLEYDEPGFEEILDLIAENTSRVTKGGESEGAPVKKLAVREIGDYGSLPIKGSKDVDEPANSMLTETAYFETWINQLRDSIWRPKGLAILFIGFSLQLVSTAISFV